MIGTCKITKSGFPCEAPLVLPYSRCTKQHLNTSPTTILSPLTLVICNFLCFFNTRHLSTALYCSIIPLGFKKCWIILAEILKYFFSSQLFLVSKQPLQKYLQISDETNVKKENYFVKIQSLFCASVYSVQNQYSQLCNS